MLRRGKSLLTLIMGYALNNTSLLLRSRIEFFAHSWRMLCLNVSPDVAHGPVAMTEVSRLPGLDCGLQPFAREWFASAIRRSRTDVADRGIVGAVAMYMTIQRRQFLKAGPGGSGGRPV